ncbi:FadR/GntR family transcriptional regulator [Sphingobium sp. H39-3-25]|uniref:FadR/GntR family transcriptional regulator n=1 Tax=Sphingobium arseniciresistens TaxID=3030834 RepID=UPI0023B8D6E8|nr:FadR/GntR family transcriptional regulator [Sphingobium arseniciresistens]
MSTHFPPLGETDRSPNSGQSESRPKRVARLLSERISQHKLQPGAKLPSENALAAHFGVSRAVVREAVAMLKAEGLVETFQGSGAFVRAPQPDVQDGIDRMTRASVETLLDLIDVRKVVESEMASRAATHRTEAQLAAIDYALERLRTAQAEGKPGVIEDRAFHTAVADACGSIYWRKLSESLAKPIEIAIGVTRLNEALRSDFAIAVAEEHVAIRDAIAAGDPDGARAAASNHMHQSAQRVLSADQEFWMKGGARVADLPAAN